MNNSEILETIERLCAVIKETQLDEEINLALELKVKELVEQIKI